MFEGLLSPTHLILILAIALLVLGPKRLPEAGRGLGEAIRGLKESLGSGDDTDRVRSREASGSPAEANTGPAEDRTPVPPRDAGHLGPPASGEVDRTSRPRNAPAEPR